MNPADYFDQRYRASNRYWWRDNPDRYSPDPNSYPCSLLTQMTLRLLQSKPQGRALDLGAGEGADAIRLALLGYEVDAVEISSVAANKISRFAAEVGAKVNVIVADITEFLPDTLYDVVISNGVLHYVKNKDSAIDRMQNATNVGGMNVISLWSTYTRIPACHNFIPMFCDDEDGVVSERYAKWTKELIYFERDKKETAHSDLPPHSHSHIKMIARKVS